MYLKYNTNQCVYTDPNDGIYSEDPKRRLNEKRRFAKCNLQELRAADSIEFITGYFGWEDLPEKEKLEYKKEFKKILRSKGNENTIFKP